jgi:hypothetical protein
MLWDPLNAWPKGRRWLWVALTGLVCLTNGPEFLRSLCPARDRWTDFFQEWASARNYCHGLPIYADHQLAVERHLGYYLDGEGPNIHKSADLIKVNAHPPTAVFLALPLAAFDYPDAVLAWNLLSLGALLLSLWLVARALAIPVSAWSGVPLIALLLLCNPFRAQVFYGQLSLVLLLLLTGTWIAHRSNRPIGAGMLLGLAVAIKLFPAFLFVFFVLRRQWKTVASGILTLLVVTAVTAAVLGMESYRIYAGEVVPQVARFRNGWCNASLPGLSTKLFDPRNTRIEPLYSSMLMAQAGTWLSCSVVGAVLAWITRHNGGPEREDRDFALTVTAMLLVSPITWDHYFLLLLAPLAVAWTRLPATNLARMTFLAIVFVLWMRSDDLYQAFIPGGATSGTATSWQTLCILSLPCYALLLFFALLTGLPSRRSWVSEQLDQNVMETTASRERISGRYPNEKEGVTHESASVYL